MTVRIFPSNRVKTLETFQKTCFKLSQLLCSAQFLPSITWHWSLVPCANRRPKIGPHYSRHNVVHGKNVAKFNSFWKQNFSYFSIFVFVHVHLSLYFNELRFFGCCYPFIYYKFDLSNRWLMINVNFKQIYSKTFLYKFFENILPI